MKSTAQPVDGLDLNIWGYKSSTVRNPHKGRARVSFRKSPLDLKNNTVFWLTVDVGFFQDQKSRKNKSLSHEHFIPEKPLLKHQTSLRFSPGLMFHHASTIPTSAIRNIVGNNTLPKIIINTCTSSTLCKIAVAIQKSNKKDQSSARHLLTWNSTPSKSENNCQYLANPSFNRCNFIYTGQFLKFHLKGNLSNIQATKHTKKMILNKDFRPWYLDWLLQHDFWNVALQTHVSRLQWPTGGLQFVRKIQKRIFKKPWRLLLHVEKKWKKV